MRRRFGALAAALIFAACAGARAAPDGPPRYGAWGFDATGAAPGERPGDSFFRHANGAWLDRTRIPPDRGSYTVSTANRDLIDARLRDLLDTAGNAPAERATLGGKVARFYRSFMDAARVERLGAAPIAPQIGAVRRASTRDELAALMGRSTHDFESTIFSTAIDADLKDPGNYALYLGQADGALPDRDYYLKPEFGSERAAYRTYIATLLKLLEWEDAEAMAERVLAFETALSEAKWSKVQQRDLTAQYNPMSLHELQQFAPGFGWTPFFAGAKLDKLTRVVVLERTALPKLAALFGATEIPTLRAWQAFHVADNAAPYLSSPFSDAHFGLHYRVLGGQLAQRARWQRAVTAVSGGDFLGGERFGTFGTMGFGVGQLYTARYFKPAVKAQVETMVRKLKGAYRARLEALDWMGEATRDEAIRKLDTFVIKVGYPDKPRDYAPLVIDASDLVGNVLRCAALDWQFVRARLGAPVDRADWAMTPQTPDAYNGSLRDIVFPAAILMAPMFDPAADPAINYGAIGAVIGHEMVHGFDDQGRAIDATGALRDWWADADSARFKERAAVLGAQFSRYEPIPGARVNGDLTMGENIADLGGLALALDAYRAALGGRAAPLLDGVSGEQRLFFGYAQAWRGKVSDNAVRKQVASNPHSPRQFRVDGIVRNLDAWYEAFGVQPGDALYLPPPERVRIW